MTQVAGIAALVVLLVISGIGDANGFVHAARIWDPDHSAGAEVVRSAAWFAMGISVYWVSLYWAHRLGITSAGLQTLLWFAVTLVGVAVITGDVGRWAVADQALAGVLVLVVGVLLFRHASA